MSRQFYNYIRKIKTYSFENALQWFDLSTTRYSTILCRKMLQDWLAGDKRPIIKLKKLLEISEYDGYILDTPSIILKEFAKLMDNDPAIDKERQKLRYTIPRFLDYKYNNTLRKVYDIDMMIPTEYHENIIDRSYTYFKDMLDINAKELYMIAAKEFYNISQNKLLLDNASKYTTDELIDKVVNNLRTYSIISTVAYCCLTFKTAAGILNILDSSGTVMENLTEEECAEKINQSFPELLTNMNDIREISDFIFNTKPVGDIGNKSIIDQIPTYIADDEVSTPVEDVVAEEPNIIYVEPKVCKDVLVINPKRDVLDYTESIIDELCDKIMDSENAKLIARRIITYHRNANYIKDRISHRVDSRLQKLLKTVLPKQRLSKINLCKERALQYQYKDIENRNHAISQLLFDNLSEMVSTQKEFYDIASKYYLNKNIINSTTPEESFHAMYYDGAAVYILYFLDEIANKLTNRWRA